MRILIILLSLASIGHAADVVIPPKAPAKQVPLSPVFPGSLFLAEPDASVAKEAGPLKLSVRKFRWIIIDDTKYAGPITLDGADNPAVTIFAAKPGVEYPGWKEDDTSGKAGLFVAPASKNEVFWVGGESAGLVNIVAWGMADGKPKKLGLITLNVGGAPQPGPTPSPDPFPAPTPFAGKWQYVIIEETETAANNRGQFFADKALHDYTVAKCAAKPRIADQNVADSTGQPPKDLVPYLNRAKGKPLPQLYIVTDGGKVLFEGNLPATPADMLFLLKSIGG